LEAERELHRLLFSASGNELLTGLLSSLLLQQRRILAIIRATGEYDYVSEAIEHRRLLNDVLLGDPERAERAAVAHLRASRQWLLERVRELDALSPPAEM
jgi:DNA-binding GntR family transcriptional regulator